MGCFCPKRSDIDQCLKFAKQEFELGSKSNPNSELNRLLSVKRQGLVVPRLEEMIELPESCQEVFRYFTALSETRNRQDNYPRPITYLEMQAYFSLFKTEPLPWELALIRDIDSIYLSEKTAQENKRIKEATK